MPVVPLPTPTIICAPGRTRRRDRLDVLQQDNEEAVRLFVRAEERGVIVMEATRHLHLPEYDLIRDAIARLGTIRYAHFEMLQYSSRYDRFRAGEQLNYGSMIADVVYSKIAQGVGPSSIVGEKGALTIDSLSEPSRVVLRADGEDVVLLDIEPRRPVETMHHELIAFADQIEAGTIDPRWKNVTLSARRIMDEHLARTAKP